jgi:hypothetical protein
MKYFLSLLLVLFFWYGVIFFLTEEVNPLEWGIIWKLFSLWVVYAIFNHFSKLKS